MTRYDILVVGGGVNGSGIARDAAGRGYSVLLAEKGDLASGTSSASTKLIHGGLRYLEYYEFRLVREALAEREVLLTAAPHIIRPLRFVLPHHSGLRAAWLLRLGLFLYDHLGGRRLLAPTRTVKLREDPLGAPLRETFTQGFEYSDCWVDDARLVVLNAVDAATRGANIRIGTRVAAATRGQGAWRVRLEDGATGAADTVEAQVLVNATGPWTGSFQSQVLGRQRPHRIRLVKGSHLVVPRLFDHDSAYIFQNADGRIIFAIPYEGDFTLIGTTDEDHDGAPEEAQITAAEIDYLCNAASGYFRIPVRPDQVAWTFAGVRPLNADGAPEAKSATRDYVLDLDGGDREPALLNVIGGKITTYRRLAEAALQRIAPFLPKAGGPWTARAPLPGGDFPVDGLGALVDEIAAAYPFLMATHAHRLARAYGTRARDLLGDAHTNADLGRVFGADLTEREVDWLMRREWARSAADVVWRRSKLGVRMSKAEIAELDAFMVAGARSAAPAAAVSGGSP